MKPSPLLKSGIIFGFREDLSGQELAAELLQQSTYWLYEKYVVVYYFDGMVGLWLKSC